MNEWIRQLLSLSLCGTILMMVLLMLKKLYKNYFSKCWQYYIWLAVTLRFLIPNAPDAVVFRILLQTDTWTGQGVITDTNQRNQKNQNQIAKDASGWQSDTLVSGTYSDTAAPVSGPHPVSGPQMDNASQKNSQHTDTAQPQDPVAGTAGILPFPDFGSVCVYLFLIWLVPASVFLLRKIRSYCCFMHHIRTTCKKVSDPAALNLLAGCAKTCNLSKPVKLYRSPQLSSPVMAGFFHPCIVITEQQFPDTELSLIFTHEMIHYKRLDLFYKWLVQIVVCIHWFNPLVYLLEKEVNRACELSCDEAVIRLLGRKERKAYGDTLLLCARTAGSFRHPDSFLTLTEGAEQLKERLGEIMNVKTATKKTKIWMASLTACIVTGSAAAGAYIAPAYAAQPQTDMALEEHLTASSEKKADALEADSQKGRFSEYAKLLAFRKGSYQTLTVAQFREKVTFALDTPEGLRLLDQAQKDEEVHQHLFDDEDAFFLSNTLWLANGSWQKRNLSAVGTERPLKNGQTAELEFRAQIRILNPDIPVLEYENAYRGLADTAADFLKSKTDAQLSDKSGKSEKQLTKEALKTMQKYAKAVSKKGNLALTTDWCCYASEEYIPAVLKKEAPERRTEIKNLPARIKKLLTLKAKNYKNYTLSEFWDYTGERYEADDSLWKASQGYFRILQDEKVRKNLSKEDYEFLTVTLPCTASESTNPSDRAGSFPPGFGGQFDLPYPQMGTKMHFEWYAEYEIQNPDLTIGERDRLILNVIHGMHEFVEHTPDTADTGSQNYMTEMRSCLEQLAEENSGFGLEITVSQCMGG